MCSQSFLTGMKINCDKYDELPLQVRVFDSDDNNEVLICLHVINDRFGSMSMMTMYLLLLTDG